LQCADLEGLAAAHIGAGQLVVAADHIGLGLGEAGAIALIGTARQLRAFATDDPCDFVFSRLATAGTGQGVGANFGGFVEKIALFHHQAWRFWRKTG